MGHKHMYEEADGIEGLTKVRFPLSESDRDVGVLAEYLWAKSLDDHNYRIDNIPFYVYGISLGDVVHAASIEGILEFQGVVMRSGHSTYRVLLENTTNSAAGALQVLLTRLDLIGCSRELAKERLIAIDVPPATDVFGVYEILKEGEEAGTWSFEEAHCGHPI